MFIQNHFWYVSRAANFWVVVSFFLIFHPYLGKIPILTNIFQRDWNHQLDLNLTVGDTTHLALFQNNDIFYMQNKDPLSHFSTWLHSSLPFLTLFQWFHLTLPYSVSYSFVMCLFLYVFEFLLSISFIVSQKTYCITGTLNISWEMIFSLIYLAILLGVPVYYFLVRPHFLTLCKLRNCLSHLEMTCIANPLKSLSFCKW